MLPHRLDITIALKMINLMPELSGTDKRVAAGIIEPLQLQDRSMRP